ncbi:16S rRNA (guanine(527)-N(7))-methyltransferase RsmG [Deinococcus deserti]|uniref:Ribosomal RNA small subunit methyltransferase G n=1 Tax=Deinococcus deserti (strain DSM 17065 / CIP 109153 / LMG 22923 / VCD115) TaxID=546414 RepID=RSMG_DEIDV|nr:16S rRNA (guanine(527)-N(7))-methyltransferase RsmG [Deinococcus deserti]C1D0A7.1 RecName: Full=Ribosomal RNA small subunit methyltransferase G; AltName: Full=16S rRNA 7-methylguanosine methyltransferase; Short=16S rRNA m7G methyltransferase [Deinococcus deserti VCD115]ACO47376.1 putative methyltransferase (Glucose-inhibited division protein B) [Deinococcus deserti VCD115]
MNPEATELLLAGAQELGLDVAPVLDQFAALLVLLQEGNARFNLTALKTERDIVLKHFVDSLTCLGGGHLDGNHQVVDLGTGAGFPTLPLALMRAELQFTPVDSTRKKVEFVRATAEALGLQNVRPVAGRAETLTRQPEHRDRYDRVVVRAVAALPILAELALPFLRPGGLLVAQKGPISPEELRAGQRAAGELGGRVTEVEAFTLPVLGDARTLVVVEKLRDTPDRYPRREGVPNQQPLFWSAK